MLLNPAPDMNLVQSLLYNLDISLSPINTASREQLETVFNYCLIWALGAPLGLSDDGVNYRTIFSDYWKNTWKNVKFPSRGASNSVFDFYLEPETNAFEQWTKSPQFYTIDFNSQTMNMLHTVSKFGAHVTPCVFAGRRLLSQLLSQPASCTGWASSSGTDAPSCLQELQARAKRSKFSACSRKPILRSSSSL